MYCSEETLERIKANLKIETYIQHYIGTKIKLVKHNHLFLGLCPFHPASVPTFLIDTASQTYGCYQCGRAGDIFDFVMHYYHRSFSDAVCILSMIAGVTVKPNMIDAGFYEDQKRLMELNQAVKEFYQMSLYKNKKALDYTKARKLEAATLLQFGIGYSNPSTPVYHELQRQGFDESDILSSGIVSDPDPYQANQNGQKRYDKFYHRIVFPIQNECNQIIGFGGRVMNDKTPKYINSRETILYDKSANLFGLNAAKDSSFDYFLLCEGFLDVIRLHQSGLNQAVASLGTALTMNQIKKMKRYKNKIVLTYDSDMAGFNAAKRAIPMLESQKIEVTVIDLTPFKDPDEFINHLGASEFLNRIQSSEPADAWLVKTIFHSHELSYEQKMKEIARLIEQKKEEKEML